MLQFPDVVWHIRQRWELQLSESSRVYSSRSWKKSLFFFFFRGNLYHSRFLGSCKIFLQIQKMWGSLKYDSDETPSTNDLPGVSHGYHFDRTSRLVQDTAALTYLAESSTCGSALYLYGREYLICVCAIHPIIPDTSRIPMQTCASRFRERASSSPPVNYWEDGTFFSWSPRSVPV